MYSSRMLRTQIYLPEEMVAALREQAALEDVSVSEVVRTSVRKRLKSPSKKLSPLDTLVGKVKSGEKISAVEAIDSYYRDFGK